MKTQTIETQEVKYFKKFIISQLEQNFTLSYKELIKKYSIMSGVVNKLTDNELKYLSDCLIICRVKDSKR